MSFDILKQLAERRSRQAMQAINDGPRSQQATMRGRLHLQAINLGQRIRRVLGTRTR